MLIAEATLLREVLAASHLRSMAPCSHSVTASMVPCSPSELGNSTRCTDSSQLLSPISRTATVTALPVPSAHSRCCMRCDRFAAAQRRLHGGRLIIDQPDRATDIAVVDSQLIPSCLEHGRWLRTDEWTLSDHGLVLSSFRLNDCEDPSTLPPQERRQRGSTGSRVVSQGQGQDT